MAKQADLYGIDGKKKGKVELPAQFEEEIRPDIIKRAVLSLQSHNYQPYGSDPIAGKRQGYATSKRRRRFRGTYGHSRSRIRRKHSWNRGTQFGWIGAFVANAISGRKAFPPQADKVLSKKINKKERRKAIRSAITASQYIVVEDKLESLSKTQDVQKALINLQLSEKLQSCQKKTIRSGKGTLRGRRYKKRRGPLLVVSKDCGLLRSADNLSGIDTIQVKHLNANLLAPGTNAGRITVWSKSAIELLKKEELFV